MRLRRRSGESCRADMSRFTGLSKEVIDQANLRIDVQKFTHYLLIDQKLRVGRLDGRFTGPIRMGCWTRRSTIRRSRRLLRPLLRSLIIMCGPSWGTKPICLTTFVRDDENFEKNWDWGSASRRVSGHGDGVAAGIGERILI